MVGVFGAVGVLFAVAIGLALYFVPTFIGSQRRHHSLAALFALNLLLGWTFVGGVAALVWALA